jgi:hypothetical protein
MEEPSAKRIKVEDKFSFTNVMFQGKNFNLSGKKTEFGIVQVTGLVDNINKRIEMTIFLHDKSAKIENFFYPAGDRSKDFRNLRGTQDLDADFVHDTMTILCLIALFCNCRKVSLQDAAWHGPFKLSNKRFIGPAYLDYYGKYYGFIKDYDVSDLDDAVSKGEEMQEMNKQLANMKLKIPIVHNTPEKIVHDYFVFSQSKKDIPFSTSGLYMDSHAVSRYRHMDPDEQKWIVFDREPNKFKVEQVPFSYGIESRVFTIRAI